METRYFIPLNGWKHSILYYKITDGYRYGYSRELMGELRTRDWDIQELIVACQGNYWKEITEEEAALL